MYQTTQQKQMAISFTNFSVYQVTHPTVGSIPFNSFFTIDGTYECRPVLYHKVAPCIKSDETKCIVYREGRYLPSIESLSNKIKVSTIEEDINVDVIITRKNKNT